MPPRTKKTPATTAPPVVDPPIIYFLRVSKEAQNVQSNSTLPKGMETTEYSDILKEETTNQQFDESVIHEIVAKIHHQTVSAPGTACFWCCHTFSWKSIVLPTHYDAYINQYSAEGHFCSPECALAWNYADARITDSQRWIRHSLLQSLYGRTDIHRAPDKRVLRLFGGTLSIEQYRRYVIVYAKH